RVEREKRESIAWGKHEVVLELVSLMDVFEQALNQAHTAKDLKHVVQGVEMLHKSFSQFLKSEGLEQIDTVGKPVNPEKAEVIAQVEVDDDDVGKVLEEFQKGYMFQGRILRPSRVGVGVARKKEKEKESKKKKDAEEDPTEPQE